MTDPNTDPPNDPTNPTDEAKALVDATLGGFDVFPFAQTLWNFHSALRLAGFDDRMALFLTTQMLTSVIASGGNSNGAGGQAS